MVIVSIVVAGSGYYFLTRTGGMREENLISENVAKIGLTSGEVKQYFKNVENAKIRYTQSAEERASWSAETTKEELEKTGFEEVYIISATVRRKIDNKRYLALSVFSDVNRTSSIQGANQGYDSFYSQMKEEWENKGINPEEKALSKYSACLPENQASEVVEKGGFGLGDESFARYYEHFHLGKDGFGITFRERNVNVGVFIVADTPCFVKKGIELAKIIENRLKVAE